MERLRSVSHETLIEDILNHHLCSKPKFVCMCVCLFLHCITHHSALPESISLEMDIRTSCVTSCLSASSNNFSLYHKLAAPSVVFCHLRSRSGTCTLGLGQERGETGWLIGDISPEGTLSAFWQEKWLTENVCFAGRHGHPEVGEWRGPEWQKMCQRGDNKQGHANYVTNKTIKGRRGFWGDGRHAVFSTVIRPISNVGLIKRPRKIRCTSGMGVWIQTHTHTCDTNVWIFVFRYTEMF